MFTHLPDPTNLFLPLPDFPLSTYLISTHLILST